MTTTGEIKVKTFNFTWAVYDFSKLCEKGGETYSPVFSIGDAANESLWRISLYPSGNDKKFQDYLSLFIHPLPLSNGYWLKNYAFQLSLVDSNGNKKCKLNSSVQLQQLNGTGWGWPQFCKKDIVMDKKNCLLVNDTLNVFCCIALNPYSTEETMKQEIMENNYEALYSRATLSDLTISIGAKKIKAHKIILSCRSNVFRAMFEHDMMERNTDTIEINDISYEVMDELLLFLYCGRVQNIKKLAKPLLIAADKYDISSLKAICERTLFESLDVLNACEILAVADCYNCVKLKSESIDFIVNNIRAVTATGEFKELKTTNPELLETIVCKMAQDNNQFKSV